MQSIELKVGGSSIKIGPDGITIKGPKVAIQADVMADIKGAMTSVKADAMLTMKGGITMIN
jgi:type VI secretion system secreted protein VgrG